MPLSRDLDPSESLLTLFGYELRRYRLAAGLSQEQLGRETLASGSLVGMIETAQRAPKLDFTQRADKTVGADGALTRLWSHVGKEAHPAWFRPFAVIEREAKSIREFEPLAVPGLLQTEEYARAMLHSTRPGYTNEQIEELVAARMERQEVFAHDSPPLLLAIVDESVLRRPVGGPKLMAEQLEHLATMASQHSKVVVQVVPDDDRRSRWTYGSVCDR